MDISRLSYIIQMKSNRSSSEVDNGNKENIEMVEIEKNKGLSV